MKKVFSSLLILVFALTLIGCKKKEKPKPTPTPPIDNVELREVKETKVVTFDGPKIFETSKKAAVSVEGIDLFVYETRVNHGRVFSFSEKNMSYVPLVIFDFEGKVNVTVTILDEESLTDVVITPRSYNITPTVNKNQITFTLEQPTTYTIEYNNQTEKVVHLITHEPEANPIDENNIPKDTIYIGPGVYKSDAIPVESNKTVYIAGGAVVYGQIRGGNCDNVKVMGRGIISGSIYPRTKSSEFTIPFEFQRSTNISVEGVTFLDSAGWTINAYFIDGFKMNDVAIITGRGNGDGISIQSCKNVEVKNCFVRTWDDSLVVKNYNMGESENILFKDCTIWTDLAQSMEVGYECYGETLKNVEFNNITILHNFHKAPISIHNADQAKISDIKFLNITIEDAAMQGDNATKNEDNMFIDFQVLYNSEWTSSGGVRGSIDKVTVDNVLVLKAIDFTNSKINGYDESHKITNVTLNNITYAGKNVTSASDLNLVSKNASGIKITSNKTATGATAYKRYDLNLTDNKVNKITKENIEQEGFLVPDFAIREVQQAYMGIKLTGDFQIKATVGSGTEWDNGTGAYEGANLSTLLDNDLNSGWQGLVWNEENNKQYVALSITFDSTLTIGKIRLYGDQKSKIYLTEQISVYGIKESSTTGAYTKISSQSMYEFTPATGNYEDIVINPGKYKGIQIRIYNYQGTAYPVKPFLNEIEFYPASLTFGKVIEGTAHEDVYKINNLIDGNQLTYYESKKEERTSSTFITPVEIKIDLEANYDIKYINLYLVPLLNWEARTEEITISVSLDGVTYKDLYVKEKCLFDPATGSVVEFILDNPEKCRFIKFTVYSNTASGGEGAQLSEITVYE